MTGQKQLEARKYVLTLTGSSATRAMLHDVRCHLKYNHPQAICNEFADFGGRANPIAKVEIVSPRANVDASADWMRKRAGNKFPFSVIIEDHGLAQPSEPALRPEPSPPAEL